MRRSMIAVLSSAALGLSLAGADPATAETGASQPYTVRLQVQASDLESEAAVHALYMRVVEAADAICADMARDRAMGLRAPAACRRALVGDAIGGARLAVLTRHYAALQNGRAADDTMAIAAR